MGEHYRLMTFHQKWTLYEAQGLLELVWCGKTIVGNWKLRIMNASFLKSEYVF